MRLLRHVRLLHRIRYMKYSEVPDQIYSIVISDPNDSNFSLKFKNISCCVL